MLQHIIAEATRTDNKLVLENRAKFVLVHCSSGHKQALREVLADKAIQSKLADTRFAKESRALDKFFRTLNDVPEKAYYSYNHVKLATDLGAVSTLLVTDSLFRSADISTRRRYIKLVEDVRAQGGEVMVLSSLHVTGEQLQNVSGVAAILKFPMEEPEGGFVEEELAAMETGTMADLEEELASLKTSNKMSKGLIDDVWADTD
jgi:protein pelota